MGSQQAPAPVVVRDVASSVSSVLAGRLDQISVTGGTGSVSSAMTTNLTGNSGRSGANGLKDTAIWANFGYTSLNNDDFFTAYDGRVMSGMVGIDTKLADPLTVGVAFGYENLDLDTSFNTGTMEWNGYTISPYVVFRFLRNYSIDGTVAYSWLDTDVSRLNGAVTGNYESDRWIAATNLNGNWELNRWRFGASIGYLYIRQDDNPYNEAGTGAGAVDGLQTRIGQGRAGVRLGYDFGMIEPYAKARVEHDFKTSTSVLVAPAAGITSGTDRTGYTVGLGALFDLNSRWSGGVEATTTQGRDDQEIWGVTGTIRFKF